VVARTSETIAPTGEGECELPNDPILRLFSFRPVEPGSIFDARLRDIVLPRFVALDGLADTFVGRQGPDETGERLIVSVWESVAQMEAALRDGGRGGRFELELAAEVSDPVVEVLPLRVSIVEAGAASATILRVFRGQVLEADLERYVEAVRAGAEAGIERGHGPLALYMGVAPAGRFVTVSAWTDWPSIELATGGDVDHPIATRHSRLIVAWSAQHYEILPNAAGRPVRHAHAIE